MILQQRQISNVLALLAVALLSTPLPVLASSIDGDTGARNASVAHGENRVLNFGVGLPEGITFTTLASGETHDLVEDPFCATKSDLCVTPRLLLERIPLAPGESIIDANTGPMPDHLRAQGPELLYVESGRVVLATEPDPDLRTGKHAQEDTYAAGQQAFLPVGEYVDPFGNRGLTQSAYAYRYELRNDTSEPACVLRLSLGEYPDRGNGGGFSSDVSGAAIPSCREYRTLAVGFDTAWTAAPATLFITQLTLEPGSSLGPVAYSGPVGLATDGGTLGFSSSNGEIDDLYRDDEGVVIPAGLPHELQARGDEPVHAIMAGVMPSGQQWEVPIDPETGSLAPSVVIPRAEPVVEGNSYASPKYSYTLTWGDSWKVAALSSASQHNQLDLSNGTGRVYLTSYDAYAGDAGRCLEAATERLLNDPRTSSYDVMRGEDDQLIESQNGERAYRQFSEDSERAVQVFYVECITLVPGQAVLEVKATFNADDGDRQVPLVQELLGGLVLP